MQEAKLLPSRELIIKVKFIGDTKHKVSNAGLRGEFNRFGCYVQEKYLTYYSAGGKHIPKLEFGIEMDLENPFPKDKKGKTSVRWNVAVRKYKPGDWEKDVDLTYKFARVFCDMVKEEEQRAPLLDDLYPHDSPEWHEGLRKAMYEWPQARHQLVLQKLRSDTSWQDKNYEVPSNYEMRFVK